jgi:hypothetical protein
MSSMAVALPILPGKSEAWQNLIAEMAGPRRPENDEFHQRLGLTRANWYLQQTPQGDMAIVHLEGEDAAGSFQKWAESDHPFDVWFKQQVGPLYGIDFNQPPAGPPSQMVYEYRAS